MAKRKKHKGKPNGRPHNNSAPPSGPQALHPGASNAAEEDALINEVWAADEAAYGQPETILPYHAEDDAWPESIAEGDRSEPGQVAQEVVRETTEPGPAFAAASEGEAAENAAGGSDLQASAAEPELPADAHDLAAAMDAAEAKDRKRKGKRGKKHVDSNQEAAPPAPAESEEAVSEGAAPDDAPSSAPTAETLPDNVLDLFGADGQDPESAAAEAAEPEDDLPLEEGLERLEGARLESVVESLLFASDKLMSMADLRRLTNVRDTKKIQKALDDLKDRRLDSGIVLIEAAGSFRMQTNPVNADWVGRMVQGKPVRLSRAMMETLAIVAYKQPITRPEVDDIRGVDCGPVLRTLLDRNLVRVIGKKEDVGRPLLYGTTPDFLKTFSLSDLTELPTLREFHELGAEESQKMKQTFGEDAAPAPERRASAEGPQGDEAPPEASAAPAAEGAGGPETRVDGLKGDRPSAFSNKTVADVPEDDSLIEELERATEAASRALDAGKNEPGSPAS